LHLSYGDGLLSFSHFNNLKALILVRQHSVEREPAVSDVVAFPYYDYGAVVSLEGDGLCSKIEVDRQLLIKPPLSLEREAALPIVYHADILSN